MASVTWQLDDLGIANKDLPKFYKKITYKVDLPFLTNTTAIRENEVLVLPP